MPTNRQRQLSRYPVLPVFVTQDGIPEFLQVADPHSVAPYRPRDALSYTQAIVDTVREPLLVLHPRASSHYGSRAFYQTFAVSPSRRCSSSFMTSATGSGTYPVFVFFSNKFSHNTKAFQDFEVVHTLPTTGRKVMLLNARKLFRASNNTEHILLAVTQRKRIVDELVRSNEDLQRFAVRFRSRPQVASKLRAESAPVIS